jgi:hypothetical protein
MEVVRLREKKDLVFTVSSTCAGGNRLERRRKASKKGQKPGELTIKKKARLWGMRHPKPRTSSVVDPSAVMPGAPGNHPGGRMIPKPVLPLAIDKAEKRKAKELARGMGGS